MILQDAYNSFLVDAKRLPNFITGTKEECDDIQSLANTYCNAEEHANRDVMSSCISALFIRYWYMIPYLYNQSKSLKIEREDVISMLYEAFLKAFKNKKWLNVNDKLYNDKHGAQKCIEKCIDSVRLTHYQLSNYDVRKINYITHSIDMVQEVYGDSSEELLYEENFSDNLDVTLLIEKKLKEGKVLSAIIIDCICFQDSILKTNKLSLTKLISNLDSDYYLYFVKTYKLNTHNVTDIIEISKMSRKKLMYNINKEIAQLGKDSSLVSLYANRCN